MNAQDTLSAKDAKKREEILEGFPSRPFASFADKKRFPA